MASHIVRPPAVAGSFYPADAGVLSAQVHDLLVRAPHPVPPATPKALLVPHAGYVYSGAVAASAYALLEPLRDTIRRVVLLGPSHRVPLNGMALPGCNRMATPLGEMEVDAEGVFSLARLPGVVVDDRPHAAEHALEVQLPFLQTVLDHASVLPISVGQAAPEQVAAVLEAVWGGPETLVLVSSDLSHYHAYADARQRDHATIERVLSLSPTLRPEDACGAMPLNGFFHAARKHGLRPQLLDLRNSGDTAGDRSRVVGYASVAFSAEAQVLH
ncbi:AmmeMemoRadiSam system protein B [Uliginosibacterium sp. H1]|uniref:AmmeMemoRadiSam system protein B n=1 Tax=Uliginosibacterium sp. H1 TaxID=3114757 RepID=UPI002E192737|nr:AmmeMemoRadiSam system protein B [Uliginosibacterium sp. H1]